MKNKLTVIANLVDELARISRKGMRPRARSHALWPESAIDYMTCDDSICCNTCEIAGKPTLCKWQRRLETVTYNATIKPCLRVNLVIPSVLSFWISRCRYPELVGEVVIKITDIERRDRAIEECHLQHIFLLFSPDHITLCTTSLSRCRCYLKECKKVAINFLELNSKS